MLSVYTNVASNIGRLNSSWAQAEQLSSTGRISSGKRINSSSDDAVGLAVSNKITKTIKGLNASLKNISDGISVAQIAQNSASEISNKIIRIRELAIQNHNGTYSDNDRRNSQVEIEALLKQIDQIGNNTSFNSKNLIDGSYLENLRTGNLNTEQILLDFDRLASDSLGGGSVLTKQSVLKNRQPTFDYHNKTRISVIEAEKIVLTTSILSADFQNFVTSTPNGNFEISGSNSNIFSVNQTTGELISNKPISYNSKNESENIYKINLNYETPSGLTMTELIRIKVEELSPKFLETKTAQTDLTSQEAENVKIQALNFPSGVNNSILSLALTDYIATHPNGTFSLEGNDATNFSISAHGKVIGNLDYNSPQDIDQDNIYNFSLKYQVPNGDSFLEHINLTIQSSAPRPTRPCIDNASKAAPSVNGNPTQLLREHNGVFVESYLAKTSSSVEATEAKKLSFSIFDKLANTSEELTSFIATNPGGDLSLEGEDALLFTINQFGQINLKTIADFENKPSYNFTIKYQIGENNFRNNVFVKLIDNFSDNSLHLENVNISSSEGAKEAILIANKALEQVSSFRAYVGSNENRLHHSLELTYHKLSTAKISRGRIIDSNFAHETTQLALNQLIVQSSQTIISQANASKQNLLALLE